MSCAEVIWRLSGRPLALTKCVWVMPSSCAFIVIIAAKRLLAAAAQLLGHGHRHVVGRDHRDGVHRIVDVDRVAGAKAQLGRRLAGGARRDRDHVALVQPAGRQRLERQVERHDLGDRRRIARRVGPHLVEDLARRGVHHDRGIARLVGRHPQVRRRQGRRSVVLRDGWRGGYADRRGQGGQSVRNASGGLVHGRAPAYSTENAARLDSGKTRWARG